MTTNAKLLMFSVIAVIACLYVLVLLLGSEVHRIKTEGIKIEIEIQGFNSGQPIEGGMQPYLFNTRLPWSPESC